MKVAILQRVCTTYRVPLFQQLSCDKDIDFNLFIGRDVPKSKVKNASDLKGINITKLKSIFIKLRGHFFPIHTDLIIKLLKYKPDVIICEGESNFFGYLQAILYKYFFSRNTKLVHWCFIALPGEDLSKKRIVGSFKAFFRNFFDAFLVYSSYSKKRLLELGDVSEGKIFVATNVGNVEKMIEAYKKIDSSKNTSRERLNLTENFTVLYLGTLDENKKPKLILDIAKIDSMSKINFVIAGEGTLYEQLNVDIVSNHLKNVHLVGKITNDLYQYLNAADLLIIPGRGGIVISEALAFGVPVLVHQADGTEYDLIINGETGLILNRGDVEDFSSGILYFYNLSMEQKNNISDMCRNLVENKFNSFNMINQIKETLITFKFKIK